MGWSQQGNLKGPQGVQGIQGVQGNPGAVGPAGLTWKGAWSNATAYAVNDSVSWGGSTYYASVAKAAGQPPPTGTAADPGTDDSAVNAGWAVLSVQGSQGVQGIQGIQGNAGVQGIQGTQGTAGTAGTRGSLWYSGNGAPGTIAGALAGDKYLDLTSGDVYTFS